MLIIDFFFTLFLLVQNHCPSAGKIDRQTVSNAWELIKRGPVFFKTFNKNQIYEHK